MTQAARLKPPTHPHRYSRQRSPSKMRSTGTQARQARLFASTGAIVSRSTGTPNQVRFAGAALVGTRGTVFTHNHPGNGTFSLPDVEAAIDSDLVELRAVGPTLRHRLWPERFWPTKQALRQEIGRIAPAAGSRAARAVANGAIDQTRIVEETEHQIWVLVSKSLGLHYKRERAWP